MPKAKKVVPRPFLGYGLFCLILCWVVPVSAAIDPMDPVLIKARIAPIGAVNIAPVSQQPANALPVTTLAAPADVGAQIFQTKCAVCHTPGLAGAPKVGDVEAWKPRLAKGRAVLTSHVLNGFNAMPPKGTCIECTQEQLAAALDYLLARAQSPKH